MFWYGNDMNGWGYALMIIGMLAFWGLVITGVTIMFRQPDRSDGARGTATVYRTPQQLLAERFARGEIEEDEFTSRLATLHDHTQMRS